ncbi:WPE palindromic element domain-containing protein [Wolbachia endosymbiont of Ctenocephalides felis wCfeJ]|uniref:WPE palindromic element domain-containing protein n=1 Tax=Wolbachia endosymbiont of Ctenocephalides felis wCfeJ TaxID=2732594 RepID=UPI0014471D37|nr:WPE palindromic element domain-containing protein [Wolbachia endosymbiont of Ctenocephalides felis wCfeJ]
MSFQRVTLESSEKKEWIPVSEHWDGKKRATRMTSTTLSFQRVTLVYFLKVSFQRVTLKSRKKEWIPVSATRMTRRGHWDDIIRLLE